ncbi:MAG TPA: acyl carrier protein [Gemmatimonadaceae bacterium]|jgi:acyl carrier protein|nr:acyl carrier protein [Gemmatimonadaceae bacterium]
MTDPILPAVKAYVLDAFLPGADPSELADDTPLISSGILDSLATVRLVTFLEDQYRIEVAAHEANADNLDTLAQVAALVRSKLPAA